MSSLKALFCVQSWSHVWLFVSPWSATGQASLCSSVSWSFLRFMSTESVMLSNHPMLPLLLPSIFPSIRVFSNVSALHFRWPKYWIFSFSISLFNEIYYSFRLYHSLLSFRTQFQPCRGQFPPLIRGDSPDTNGVFYHSTQFWNDVDIRFCRLSVRPYKTAPRAVQTSVMRPGC